MSAVAQLNTALAGRYDVEREIGAGGMATVYLARDVRHDRRVALKVLNPELGAVLGVDRFLAEIKVTANLQHPNLLPLFDSGEANGLLFYVMPFVEGESLRARLEREKQLPVDEAVRIAVAVASALDYAHAHGVIHRDLKPENILLQAGQPVIADFGIALAVSKAGGARVTQTGLSLGTPQYMSPEQATGDRAIDARTDIYSLAAVTYELLTGEPPHTGNTAQAIIAKLMTEEVRPLTVLRRSVPNHVDAAVRHALQKLPADRFASAREFADCLQGRAAVPLGNTGGREAPGAGGMGGGRAPGGALTSGAERVRARRLITALGAVCVLLAAGAAWLLVRGPRSAPATTARFVLNFEPNERLADGIGTPLTISRDGRMIAYAATRGGGAPKLFVRAIGELRARELGGTDGAFTPEFSPDGKWVLFIAGNQLKKVPIEGGTPVPLLNMPSGSIRGMSWGSTDRIVLGNVDGLLRDLPAVGGEASVLFPRTLVPGSLGQRWPLVLPDGNTVLFVEFSRGSLTSAEIWVGSLRDHTAKSLGLIGTVPVGVIEGRLIYAGANGALMAAPFDKDAQRVTGAPVPVVDQVSVEAVSAAARVAMSPSGNLIYQTGNASVQLVLADERGVTHPLLPELRAFGFPRFSPDGKKVAVSVSSGSGTDIWIFDRGAGTLAKLTSGAVVSNDRPEWTPDGKRLLYRSTRDGTAGVWWQPADRSGAAELLMKVAGKVINEAVVSPDGTTLLARVTGGKANQDFWVRSLRGDTTTREFIASPAYETGARFSPDGRWVVYTSDESGSREVYVTPYPGPGQRLQVSIDGGDQPIWAPDGRRIYYVQDRRMRAVSVKLAPEFEITGRQVLFEGTFAFNYVHASYDISPDGKQFLLLKASADAQTIVVLDWRAELKDLAGRAARQ